MTKVRLQGLPLEALQELCNKENLESDPDHSKEDLVELLWELYEDDRRDWESLNNLIIKMEEKKFSLFDESVSPETPINIAIPSHYDNDYLVIMLRDPLWAFCYWEIRNSDFEVMKTSWGYKGLILKVFESDIPDKSQYETIFTIPVNQHVSSRYINLPTQNKYYWVELLAILDKEPKVLCSSKVIFSPAETISYDTFESQTLNTRKILEYSGFKLCEPYRDLFVQDKMGQYRSIPQRIGDIDESMFLEETKV